MELSSRKGSIEAGKEDKSLTRLKKKQKDKMQQRSTQAGCQSCNEG